MPRRAQTHCVLRSASRASVRSASRASVLDVSILRSASHASVLDVCLSVRSASRAPEKKNSASARCGTLVLCPTQLAVCRTQLAAGHGDGGGGACDQWPELLAGV